MTRVQTATTVWRAPSTLLTLVLCTAGLLVGCSREPAGSGQLTVGVESEFERLDPLVLRNPKTLLISAQVFEGLLGLDGAGNIVPGLAEKWDTRDGKVWTFTLRKNARFHDSWIFGDARSREVRASDAAWSYMAFCGPGAYGAFVLADIVEGCGAYSAGKANSVSGLRVLNESTLEIELVRPEYAFLHRITAPWLSIFPREAARADVKDRWGLDTVVGTGPYRLLSRSATDLELVANPEYWDASRRPAIRTLKYRVIVNDQLRLAEFAQQRIDLMQAPGTLTAQILERDGVLKGDLAKTASVQVAKTFNSHVLGFNMERISDANLRRAIGFAIDRRAIVASLLYGKADISGGIVPPGLQAYVPPFVVADLYNVQRAKEALEKSNYKGEELELVVHDQANSEQIGLIVQEQLKSVGVRVRLTKVDYGTAINKMVKGESPIFSMNFEFGFSSPDLILLMHFHSKKRPVPNFWQFTRPEIDAKLDSLSSMADPASRSTASAEIEADIMRDAPGVFMFRQHNLILLSRKFSNLVVNGHGHFQLEGIRNAAR